VRADHVPRGAEGRSYGAEGRSWPASAGGAAASLSTLVGSAKGVSAHYLREEYPDHLERYLGGERSWSPSYFAASCGGAPLAVIKEYTENQKRPD
jgi:REP element-mobilizing transposase RayT